MDEARKDFIDRYFHEDLEYPDPVAVMMGPGKLLSFISITYLNGWINYVHIRSAFLVTRYREHQKNISDAAAFNEGHHTHADLGKLVEDCVVVLARAEHQSDEWWFFYSDRDVSDCEIGRFRTDDPVETVIGRFEIYAQACSGRNEDSGPALPLKANAFKGWVTL